MNIVDYAFVELLQKNNISLKDDIEYNIDSLDIRVNSIYMKLAFIDNEEVLEYLETNLLKSFNDFDIFILFKKRSDCYYNSLTLAVLRNNFKFIEVLVKNFITRKEEIWDNMLPTLRSMNSFEDRFNKLISNDYLENIYHDKIRDLARYYNDINAHTFLVNILDISIRLKYILNVDDELSIVDTIKSICLHKYNEDDIIKKYPVVAEIIDIYETKYTDDITKCIICRIVKLFNHDKKININNFKQIIEFIMDRYPKYKQSIELLTWIMKYLNTLQDNILDTAKIITSIIIKNTELSHNIMVNGVEFICGRGIKYNIVAKLLGYNIYAEILQKPNYAPLLIITDLLAHNYRRMRAGTKYDIHNSYLLKKGNLISFVDKYFANNILFDKTSFPVGENDIKIDLITAAVIVGDLAVVHYLNNSYGKNFDINFDIGFNKECDCFTEDYNTFDLCDIGRDQNKTTLQIYESSFKTFNKSSYKIPTNPYIKIGGSYVRHCSCAKNQNKMISGSSNKIPDIVSDLINDDIKHIKYFNPKDDNSKLLKHYNL